MSAALQSADPDPLSAQAGAEERQERKPRRSRDNSKTIQNRPNPNILKQLRDQGGLTLSQAAQMVGISPGTWSMAEHGHRKIYGKTAEKIAQVFNLDIEQLAAVTDDNAAQRGARGGSASKGTPKTKRAATGKDKPLSRRTLEKLAEQEWLEKAAESFEPGSVEYRLYKRERVKVEEIVARIVWLSLQGVGGGTVDAQLASQQQQRQKLASWLTSRLQVKK